MMGQSRQPGTGPLTDIAAGMTQGRQDGKFESTYARIMKGLTQALYNVPKNHTTDNSVFISMVLLDAQAARLKAKINNKIDTQTLVQTSGNISATLKSMQASKAATAFHSKYTQDFSPLQADTRQRQMEGEELGKAIGSYIHDLHTKLKTLDAEIEKSTKSDKQVENEMNALSKQWQSLEAQAEKLGINVDSLLQRLNSFHHETYVLLPAQDKSGLKPPPTIQETPKPE
jgi:uncharacterized protein YicC (UPF0701 family)